MRFANNKRLTTLACLLSSFIALPVANAMPSNCGFGPPCSNILVQAGGFWAQAGTSQHIGIDGLIGDQFSVSHKYGDNFMLGLGYFIDGMDRDQFSLMYGINAFYLAHTQVKGDVTQENMFTNLSYRYSITNWPLYLAGRALVNLKDPRYNLVVDLGVGVNFIVTDNFHEASLDNGITLPDNAFSGTTDTVFSATVGLGVRFNNLLYNCTSIELGYRFFYLGQGELHKQTDQLENSLKTGNNYANAIVVTAAF